MGRTGYSMCCIMLLLLACASQEPVSIRKAEHFYISSEDASSLFQMLAGPWGLPVVWDYQDWGGFSSGGVTLGNVVIELVGSQPEQTQTYCGIALEPSRPLASTVPGLDAAGLAHGSIGNAAQWSTMSLTNLLPDDMHIFLCDYHDRESVAAGRKRAADALAGQEGGALGIQLLQEIIIGAGHSAAFESEWAKMPGVIRDGSTFHFSEGPKITLVSSDTSFLALVIQVKSVDQASAALASMGISTRMSVQGAEIEDGAFPVRIRLAEKAE